MAMGRACCRAGQGQRHTRLLQLCDVDQSTVLGAAEHLPQPLQTHLQLALCCCLLQRLLHLLSVEGRAAQEPVEGTHQRPAEADALLCFAMAAGKGRETGLCSPWARLLCPGKPRHRNRAGWGIQTHIPCSQTSLPASSQLLCRRSQPAQPTSIPAVPGEIKSPQCCLLSGHSTTGKLSKPLIKLSC